MMSVWIAEPWVNGLMSCAMPSGFVYDEQLEAVLLRDAVAQLVHRRGTSSVVSTCSSGNGGGAG